MQKVDTTKSASHNRIHRFLRALELDFSVGTTVGEDVTLAHFDEGKLSVVAVGKKVYGVVLAKFGNMMHWRILETYPPSSAGQCP